MNARIGALTDADAGEVLTVQYAAYLAEARRYRCTEIPPLLETLDEVRAAVADPVVITLGAWLGHRLVGSVRGLPAGERMEIARFSVAPDLRRRGIGRALLAEVEGRAPEGVRLLWLVAGAVSEDNLRMYHRAGYRTVRTMVDAVGIELAEMERPRPSGASAGRASTPD